MVDRELRPVRPERYSDQSARLARDAGLPSVHLHAIRHTLGLIMHRNGVAPVDAAAFLGHSLETHIRYYLSASERGARTAAASPGALRRTAV